MGAPFRPADRLVPGTWWDSPGAKFDLTGLDASTKAALLRQWATAPYLRAEIARAAKSAQGFATAFGASVNHLRNMCNGHRLPDYPTLALVLSVAGPNHAPDEVAIARAMHEAIARSTTMSAGKTVQNFAALDGAGLGDELSAPSAPGDAEDIPEPHPDADVVRAAFVEAALRDPIVWQYQRADVPRHPDEPREFAVEVSVFVAPSIATSGVQGFVGRRLLAATLWTPADWVTSVGQHGGGVLGGAFVCAAVERTREKITRFRGARFTIEAGDSPEEWDIAVVTNPAQIGDNGLLQWGML